jgi:hypothetical protein
MKPPTTIRNPWSTPVALLSACFVLNLLYCPPADLFFDDKEIFRYIGRLIAHGGVPYRDVFDHKPPLIYFLNCFGPWGLWLIETSLTLLADLLFFRLCRRYKLPAPWILPLLFNLLLKNYLVCISLGMTRTYTAILLLLFFCLLLNPTKNGSFWLGLLAAATFFTQQDQFPILLPFFAYALLNAKPMERVRNALLALVGGMALTLPILGYFWLHHALVMAWQDAFQFNFTWYAEKLPFIVHFRAVREGMERSGCEMTFILAAVVGIWALLTRHSRKDLLTIALLGLFLSFVPEWLSGKLVTGYPFYYYFLSLSATIPILLFVVWAFTTETFLRDRKHQLLYGILVCFLPLYNALQRSTHLPLRSDTLITGLPEYKYLQQQHPADHQLYVFGNSNWVYAYNELGIFAPSPWIYHYFWTWYPNWDADHRLLGSIGNDLIRYRTTWLIDYSDSMRIPDSSTLANWHRFRDQYYRPVQLAGSSRQLLWRKK